MSQTNGTLSAANDSVILVKRQTEWYCVLDIDGTFTGLDVAVSGSIDGENYSPVGVVDRTLFTLAANGQLTGLSSRKTLELNGGSFRKVKVACSAISTGSVSVTAKAMPSGTFARIVSLPRQATQTVMGGATAIPASGGAAAPANAALWDDGTPLLWDDGTYLLWS